MEIAGNLVTCDIALIGKDLCLSPIVHIKGVALICHDFGDEF